MRWGASNLPSHFSGKSRWRLAERGGEHVAEVLRGREPSELRDVRDGHLRGGEQPFRLGERDAADLGLHRSAELVAECGVDPRVGTADRRIDVGGGEPAVHVPPDEHERVRQPRRIHGERLR